MDWKREGKQWQGNWPLLCGMVAGALTEKADHAGWQNVEIVEDGEGYTNQVRITTASGGKYLITIEPEGNLEV